MEMYFEGDGKSSLTIISTLENGSGTAKTEFQLQNYNVPGSPVLVGESSSPEKAHAFLVSTNQLNSGGGNTCSLRLAFFPVSEDGSDVHLWLKAVQNGKQLVAKDPSGNVLTQDNFGVDTGTVTLKQTKYFFFFINLQP